MLGSILGTIGKIAGAIGSGAIQAGSKAFENKGNNSSGMINDAAAQQLAARQAAINKAKNSAINNYQQEINGADGQYQPLRNQASIMGAKNTQLLKEQMAAQGLFNSGDNVTAQLQNRNQTATNINSLNTQQQDYVNKLQNAIAQVKANAEYESAQAVADVEAQKLQNLIAQANSDRAFDYQKERDTIGDSRWNTQFDYQKQRDSIGDNRWKTEFDYQKNRDSIGDNRWKMDWDRQGTWHDADTAFREKDWNREGAWHNEDITYRNAQLALSRAKASKSSYSGSNKTVSSASSLMSGTKAQKSNAMGLLENIYNDVNSSSDKYDALLKYRNLMAVSNDQGQKDKLSSLKKDVGTKNLDNIQTAVGQALIKQNQINYGANNVAKAFGYR